MVSQRFYLADAAFLVGLECEDRSILERAYAALGDPFWSLALGRKSYVPSEPIWIKGGLRDTPLRAVLISGRGLELCANGKRNLQQDSS